MTEEKIQVARNRFDLILRQHEARLSDLGREEHTSQEYFIYEESSRNKAWTEFRNSTYPNGNPMFAMLDPEQPLTIVTSNGKTGCWRLTLKEKKE